MTSEPPAAPESGLPGKQGEFAISLQWIARFALTAAIGAILGFAVSTVIAPRIAGPGPTWAMIVAGAIAAALLSIRKVHGWHVSTFVDGTVVGLAAAPIFAVLMLVHAAFQAEHDLTLGTLRQGLLALLLSFVGMLITVPCGWIAGFAYHVALSAAERARTAEDDSA